MSKHELKQDLSKARPAFILLLLVIMVLTVQVLQMPVAALPQIYTPIPVPKMQFFDNAGDPCNACKLYTYVINTSTTSSTFTDYTGATANANPVVMDSSGRATIFFSSAVNYRMVLKDSTDATTYFDIQGVRFAAVDQINGTANQVAVSANTGSVTVSLTGPHNFTTLTSNGVLYGAGTSAIAATAASSAGSSVLTSSTAGAAPGFTNKPGVGALALTWTAFADLGNDPAPTPGTIKYCSDCIGPSTTGSVTCTSGGTGALAVYIANSTSWSCK